MTKLALVNAPPPAYPMRWLLSAPVWGMLAGIGWVLYGDNFLLGRWSLATVAIVHAFVLGVLGNAMLGSLLQFLPVAANTALPLQRSSLWLHAVFNLGLMLFIPAIVLRHPGGLTLSSVFLAVPLFVFVGKALPALLRQGQQRGLRAGIGMALTALFITVLLGLILIAILRGDAALPLDRIADIHASIGVVGWVMALMCAVGSATLPMFQGTRRIPSSWVLSWLGIAMTGLLVGAIWRYWGDSSKALVLSTAPAVLLFIATSLWLPWRAPPRPPLALVWFWRMGTLSLGFGALTGLAIATGQLSASFTLLAGIAVLAVGLPLMLTGMMLEINGFLAWIRLRTTCPRGTRVPGVKQLTPEHDKWRVLGTHLAAALTLIGNFFFPDYHVMTGTTLFLAHAASLASLIACQRRASRFLKHTPIPLDLDIRDQ